MGNPFVIERIEALRRQQGHYAEAAAWIILWLVTSPLVMAGIKTLASSPSLSFPYPWLLIGFTNLGTWMFCSLLRCVPGCFPESDLDTSVPWSHAAVLGVLQGFEVGIGAEILHMISLTLRTEIHMLCPAFMFLFAVSVGIESFDPRLVLTTSVVTLGGLLASYGTLTWEGINVVPLALLASLFSALRWALTQKWLSPVGAQAKPSPILLASRMSPATALVGFLVATFRDPGAYQALLHLPYPEKVATFLVIISFGVSLMLVAEMRVVQLTSALLLAYLVPFHNVSVILLDAGMKGTKVSGLNWLGIVMCVVASGFYSIARKEEGKDSLALRFREAPPYQSAESATADSAGIC